MSFILYFSDTNPEDPNPEQIHRRNLYSREGALGFRPEEPRRARAPPVELLRLGLGVGFRVSGFRAKSWDFGTLKSRIRTLG